MRWRHLFFSLRGRIGRHDLWLHFALPFVLCVATVGTLVPPLIFDKAMLVLFPVSLWPNIAVGIKRCHDRNRHGWFLLISFIPFLGIIWLLIELGFLRGTIGPNRFGPELR